MEKETLKKMFDLEQKLGINQKDRFHNSEEGKKQYEELFENHNSCNNIKCEETTEELRIKLERLINKIKEDAIDQLQTRINEFEETIENMKAIAGEKIEPIGCISSVDYQEEKTTETKIEIQQIKKLNFHIEKTVCCNFVVRKNFNYCPNCGRKIVR